MLPSPTAQATRFTGENRTSPHAKMPGTLVSRRYGSRSSVQRPAMGDRRFPLDASVSSADPHTPATDDDQGP